MLLYLACFKHSKECYFYWRENNMARVSIKPIEPLVMEFADGTVKEALFNNEAFIIYTNEFGGFNDETMQEMKEKPYDAIAKILYCGMKVMDKTVTLDEARTIVIGGGEPLAVEICKLMVDNFMSTADENSKKKFMKEMEKLNDSITQ